MGFSAGFADEIEKLALRLPSIGQMTSGFGSEPPPAPSAVTEPAAAAPPQQNVHVHVHHQAKKTAPATPAAATPAPAQGKSEPLSRSLDMPSSDAPAPTGLPATPTFGGAAGKAAPKTYAAAGAAPGKHTAGHAAPAGTQLPSQMNTGPRWIEDTGNGPTRDAVMTPKDLLGGLAQASKPTQMAPGMSYVPTTQVKDSSYSGLQYGKGPAPTGPAPAAKEKEFSTGKQSFTGMDIPPPTAPQPGRAKKKMFGTALAMND